MERPEMAGLWLPGRQKSQLHCHLRSTSRDHSFSSLRGHHPPFFSFSLYYISLLYKSTFNYIMNSSRLPPPQGQPDICSMFLLYIYWPWWLHCFRFCDDVNSEQSPLAYPFILGAPPSYGFVTQVYRRNLRPVVMMSKTPKTPPFRVSQLWHFLHFLSSCIFKCFLVINLVRP